MDWNGKVALVTGASRGIGRDVAFALARKGVAVALNYNKSEKEAKAVGSRNYDRCFPETLTTSFRCSTRLSSSR